MLISNSIDAQDVAPLLLEPANTGTDSKSEIEWGQPAKRTLASIFADCVYSRVTYYWIAFIVQTCHIVLCTIGIVVVSLSGALDDEAFRTSKTDYNMGDFIQLMRSGLWSVAAYTPLWILIVFHYKKDGKITGRRFLAGLHVSFARLSMMLNIINCVTTAVIHAMVTTHLPEVLVPILIGLLVVASVACFTAKRITYLSAANARGMSPVPDVDIDGREVPAWTLATTEESCWYYSGMRSGVAAAAASESLVVKSESSV